MSFARKILFFVLFPLLIVSLVFCFVVAPLTVSAEDTSVSASADGAPSPGDIYFSFGSGSGQSSNYYLNFNNFSMPHTGFTSFSTSTAFPAPEPHYFFWSGFSIGVQMPTSSSATADWYFTLGSINQSPFYIQLSPQAGFRIPAVANYPFGNGNTSIEYGYTPLYNMVSSGVTNWFSTSNKFTTFNTNRSASLLGGVPIYLQYYCNYDTIVKRGAMIFDSSPLTELTPSSVVYFGFEPVNFNSYTLDGVYQPFLNTPNIPRKLSYTDKSYLEAGWFHIPTALTFRNRAGGVLFRIMFFAPCYALGTSRYYSVPYYNYRYSSFLVTDSEGYSQAFGQGFSSGYESGKTDGYNNGFSSGTSSGYENGYNVGYDAGVTAANDYSFFGLISSVLSAPIGAVTGLLDFNVLGVNMSSFFFSLLTVCIIIKLITVIV